VLKAITLPFKRDLRQNINLFKNRRKWIQIGLLIALLVILLFTAIALIIVFVVVKPKNVKKESTSEFYVILKIN